MSSYPNECLRGISSSNLCFETGLVKPELFYRFDNVGREDGFDELSITWNDSDESVQIISTQKKKNSEELQFKFGLAVLRRFVLDIAKRNPQFTGILNYERKKTKNNPYHGNILLKSGVDKQKRNMIASFLAMYSRVVPRDDLLGSIKISSSDISSLFNDDDTTNLKNLIR